MLASKNIGQFESNPHLETTTRARLNPKHPDARIRIVKVTASKNSEAVSWWHVSRWSRVGPDTRKGFGRISHGKPSTVAKRAVVILLNLLHQMIWLDIYVEKKGSTHWSKRVCLCWDGFGNSYIPMHVHVWNFWILCEVSQSEGKHNITPMNIVYRWWGRMIVCRIVIGCVDVVWILHFTLHNHISHWPRDALPMDVLLVITGHMRVLKNDTYG